MSHTRMLRVEVRYMWWTVLAVAIAVLAVLFLVVGSQIFRYGGKGGQSVADVNANRFWWKWGRRPGD